jgi:hypothetical protein
MIKITAIGISSSMKTYVMWNEKCRAYSSSENIIDCSEERVEEYTYWKNTEGTEL